MAVGGGGMAATGAAPLWLGSVLRPQPATARAAIHTSPYQPQALFRFKRVITLSPGDSRNPGIWKPHYRSDLPADSVLSFHPRAADYNVVILLPATALDASL